MTAVTTASPVLQVEGLRFRWPKAQMPCLDIQQFSVKKAETVFLRGPSGCGKSTFLSIVAGVLMADHGTVKLLGRDWKTLSSSQRDRMRADHVGYIFQQFNLLSYLSTLDNVLLACRFSAPRSKKAGDAVKTAQRLLERVGLGASVWHRKASDLSVGQQQRVAAARALIGRPDLIVADEPTSALDEALRESFMDLLLEACYESGSALIFVSHDDRLAQRFERQIDLPALNRALIRV
jgi:putative ABC transport system ATP-binding protein